MLDSVVGPHEQTVITDRQAKAQRDALVTVPTARRLPGQAEQARRHLLLVLGGRRPQDFGSVRFHRHQAEQALHFLHAGSHGWGVLQVGGNQPGPDAHVHGPCRSQFNGIPGTGGGDAVVEHHAKGTRTFKEPAFCVASPALIF